MCRRVPVALDSRSSVCVEELQILTIAELFEGKQPNIPQVDTASFKKAARESTGEQEQFPF